MESMFTVNGGTVSKETVEVAAGSIVEILKAALEHRNNEVTIKALDTLSCSLDVSISDMQVSNCTFTNNPTPEEKETTTGATCQ